MYNITGNTGSLRYMSPEVCKCQPYNEKADMYSYAVIMREVATRSRPYEDMKNHLDFVRRVALGGERPALVSDDGLELPAGLKDIVSACWDKEISKRFGASVVKLKMKELLNGWGPDARTAPVHLATCCRLS